MNAERQTSVDPGERTKAHVVPFVVFMGFLLLLQFAVEPLIKWDHPHAAWWQRYPEQWIYPLQAVGTLVFLVKWWRVYEFRWTGKAFVLGIVAGAIGIGFWLLPTTLYDHFGMSGETEGWKKWLGIAARTDGFNPGVFENPAGYWFSLVMRFIRAAVVVALVEEIFWRGFVMRFVLDWDGDYWKQPFGKPSWLSFAVVTGLFMAAHTPIDYAGALIYGSLTYLLCIWTKSLSACVIMHATANFLMGCYIMAYGKIRALVN